MRSVAAVVALVACVHAGLWFVLQRQQAVLDFGGVLPSISYNPYSHSRSQHPEDGPPPSAEQIRSELKLIAPYARGVRTDNVATRYEYVVTVDYTLAALPSGAVAKRGHVRVETTYDSADQPYASIVAQQDAQDRATEEAANPPAQGGGHGQVWVNTETGVYHREGSRFYGTTRKGKYMIEQDAKQAGYKPAPTGL